MSYFIAKKQGFNNKKMKSIIYIYNGFDQTAINLIHFLAGQIQMKGKKVC